jgi:hypothetical protein
VLFIICRWRDTDRGGALFTSQTGQSHRFGDVASMAAYLSFSGVMGANYEL